MKNQGGKTIFFLSGILIGILAGLGLVFILLNDINPFAIFKSSGNNSYDTLVDKTQKNETTLVRSPKNRLEKNTQQNTEFIDTSNSTVPFDSNSNLTDEQLNSDDIIVQRDKLIETRELKLIQIEKNGSKGKSDSLLKVFQGSSSNSIEFRIEFWNSPINYKGYKFVRNVIVAFGLDTQDPSKLFLFEDKYYLKHGASVFKIMNTEKFEPYYKVTDENLIKQLR